MTKTAEAKAQILRAVKRMGQCTAQEIESAPEVAPACRVAKVKARKLIEQLRAERALQSDQAVQMARYWVDPVT